MVGGWCWKKNLPRTSALGRHCVGRRQRGDRVHRPTFGTSADVDDRPESGDAERAGDETEIRDESKWGSSGGSSSTPGWRSSIPPILGARM